MASFDPSIISQIPDMAPDPIAAKQRAYTLANQMDEATIHHMQLGQLKTQQADTEKAKNIIKNADNSTAEARASTAERLRREVGPDYSNQFLKDNQGIESGAYDTKLKQLAVAEKQQESIVGTVDNIVRDLEQKKEQGATPAMLDARAMELATPALNSLAQQHPELVPMLKGIMANPKNLTYNGLVSLESQSKEGQARLKEHLDEFKAETERKRQVDYEKSVETGAKREADYARGITDKEKENAIKDAMKKASIMDDEDLKPLAQQYLAGDKSVLQNLGRGDAGATNIANMRRAIRAEAKAQGLSPVDIAARLAEYNGFAAEQRALGTRQANIETAATEASKVFPIAEKASEQVSRSDWVPANQLVQNFEKWHSDPKLGAFAQAVDTTVNVYARAISPTGVPHEAARQRALKLLSTATSKDNFEAVIGIMKSEIDAARTSPDQVRDEILASFKKEREPNAPPTATPGATQTPTAAPTTAPSGATSTPPAAAAPPGGAPKAGGFSHLWNGAGTP